MRKFTIFTIVLAAVVILSSLDLIANKYGDGTSTDNLKLALPKNLDLSKTMEANVAGADATAAGTKKVATNAGKTSAAAGSTTGANAENTGGAAGGATDFEDESYAPALPDIYLRPDQIKSAGFVNATITTEDSQGMLFKDIYIGDLNDVKMTKYSIANKDTPLAKVYVFTIGPKSKVDNVYDALKMRAAEGVNSEVNATDTYGGASFFLNDTKRPSTAFVVVKIGQLIYGFSYPKEYHPQIKNLIKLLEWEFNK